MILVDNAKMNHFPSNVKLLSTQRFTEGGKSTKNFENFNLALHVNDNSDRVLENRKILKMEYASTLNALSVVLMSIRSGNYIQS